MISTERKTVQWAFDFIESYYLNNLEKLTELELVYLDYLSPFSKSYFGPTCPILLLSGIDLEKLEKKDYWTIRDGLIPLYFFFKENEPLEGQKILVDSDFLFLVPNKWKKNVLFYKIEADNLFSKNNLPKEIILFGLPNETLTSFDEFEEQLKAISNYLGKENIEKINITAYLPNKRADLWGTWTDENFFKYGKVLFKELKIDIAFPELLAINAKSSYKDTLYVELNAKHFIADTFPMHMVLSKGGGLLEGRKLSSIFKPKQKLKLSLHHSIAIYEVAENDYPDWSDPFLDSDLDYYKKILSSGVRSKNLTKQWEAWMSSYLKKKLPDSKK